MNKIPLRLGTEDREDAPRRAPQDLRTPLSGWLAVGFGVLGIFGPALLFTPLCFLFSVIALFRGQAGWGFVGLLLTVGGLLSSVWLMGLLGLGAAYMAFDWQEILRPLYEWMGGGLDV